MKYFAAILVFLCCTLTLSAQNDCPEALIICGDGDYIGLSAEGPGTQELIGTNDCFSAENHSIWLKLTIKDGGTLGFDLLPTSNDIEVDFDFFLYGPNVACDSIGHAVRCSTTNPEMAGSTSNITGMNDIEADIAEGPGPHGNNYINWLTVQSGEVYYLVIDRPVGTSDFSLHWTGTARFHPIPVFNNPDNIPINFEVCDTDGNDDGINQFNLATHAAMFIGSQENVQLTFHHNLDDVTNGTNPIDATAPYVNASNPETIYMRMTNTITGCYSIESFELKVNSLPVFNNPPNIDVDLTTCDTDGSNDGSHTFNLTQHAAMFIDAQDVSVSYFTSQEDAEEGSDFIEVPDAYINIQNPQTIYMRMTDNVTGCFSIKTFELNVNLLPDFNNPQNISLDLYKCDSDATEDGFMQFDLTQHAAMLTAGQDNLQITYYESLADAQGGNNAIAVHTAFTNTSNPQTIYMRLLNTDTGCFSTGSFTLNVRPEPIFNNPQNILLDLTLCDNDGVADGSVAFNLTQHRDMLIGTQPDAVITYHLSQAEADAGINPISMPEAYDNTENPQTIYMRLADTATTCYTTASFILNVNPVPVFNNPQNISLDLAKCDTDGTNDGINIFNLEQHAAMLKGVQNVTLTYHLNLTDAVGDANAISNTTAFINTSSPQTIYMRMEDNTTGCFSTQSFEVRANLLPVFNNPQNIVTDLAECDTDGTDDGFFAFDLTQHSAMFIGSQADVTITYYKTLPNAQTGNNAIATPTAYTNTANPQTIYMRMENTVTGCLSTGSFQIRVNSLPVFNNPSNIVLDMEACDTDGSNNGSFTFNLTQHKAMLIGSQSNVTFTYHTSFSEADGGVNAIADPANFVNTLSPQTIYMRLTNNTTGCYRIHTFLVKANMLPPFLNPQNISLDLEECDVDGSDDNTFTFNLTQHAAMLTGGLPEMQLSYYKNLTNAQTGSNPIDNPASYHNISNPQTIYMRMVNTATGCINYKEFNIQVNKLPVFHIPSHTLDMVSCDTDGVPDQKFTFNLTQHEAVLTGGQTGVTITYYETLSAAQAGINAIGTPAAYTNLVSPQTIYMRMTNTATGCFVTHTFTIKVNPVPVFNNPQNLPLKREQCDNDGVDDQSSVFNLAVHATMFLGSQQGMLLSYYTSAADAASGINAITSPAAFRNTVNPQAIYVRMLNVATGCFATTSFDVEVVELLDAGEPADLAQCDTNNNGIQLFDLSQNNTAIQDGNTATSVRYYRSEADAINEVNPLPINYQNTVPYTTETIWARLENVGGCIGHDIKSFTISILPIPDIVFTTNVVDFTDHDNSITIVLPNAEDYEFSLDGTIYQDSNIFMGLEPGLYTVHIRARNNCKEVTKDVVILNYPKYFTPNGDGIHEHWQVKYLYLVPKARVTIFDRYGKLITAFGGTSEGWDGVYNDRKLPATDYWFVLELDNGRLIKGHFSLLR